MSYESPIEMVYENIHNQIIKHSEDAMIAEVQCRYNINVNKDELLKALAYDREQYEKGIEDAKRVLKPMCRYLGRCMSHPEISREYHEYCDLYQEDCNCQCLWRQNG